MAVWSEHFTKEGRVYYYNRSTKQSSWERPADFDGEASAGGEGAAAASSSASAASASASAASASGRMAVGAAEWEELWDPKNQRHYYYNRATRKTQWLRPEGVDIKPHAGAAAQKKDKHARKAAEKADKTDRAEEGGEAAQDTGDARPVAKKRAASSPHTHHKDRRGSGEKHHHEHKEGPHKAKAAAQEDASEEPQGEDKDGDDGKDAAGEAALVDPAADGSAPVKADAHHKKKKKKAKRDRALELEAQRKKRRRGSDKRMIICDDEAASVVRGSNRYDSTTEDGKEAARLLQELSRTDAVMEANVLSVINGFLRVHQEADGPEVLVEKLSSSYRGHAQMIGLVASWLDALPKSKTLVDSKITFDVSEGSVVESKGPTWAPSEEILYRHLKDIVTENYDPALVSRWVYGNCFIWNLLAHYFVRCRMY